MNVTALRLQRFVAGLVPVVLAGVLGGCFFFGGDKEDECVREEEYQGSESRPGIAVPGSLDRPDESGRLEIPAGPGPAEPLSQIAGCLQRPPNYFDTPIFVPKD